jgi:hypothetical protein
LALKPDEPAILLRLAWILATAPSGNITNSVEAVKLAERAVTLGDQRNEPGTLDILAAAYAAAGRFDLAVHTAESALAAAAGKRLDRLYADIRTRLELYRAHKTYHASLPVQ